jgi:hypothetical protein
MALSKRMKAYMSLAKFENESVALFTREESPASGLEHREVILDVRDAGVDVGAGGCFETGAETRATGANILVRIADIGLAQGRRVLLGM